ncbi:MAG: hypothetical protein JWQ28_1923 [Pedobacter sp.]|jgi:hypothetical protein|nr:hypothetical protein [Pedobacter sp.]
MRSLIIILFIFSQLGPAAGQQKDSVLSRVILIGDAGKVDRAQVQVIRSAANHILKDRTTVLFLGDNIYSRGMALAAGPEQTKDKEILKSQFLPMREQAAPVYFLPGNHDWDRSGPEGLQKVKAAWKFISNQSDSGLRMLPPNGCPDPQEIKVSADLTIIVFDSEWWLFPHEKGNKDAGCTCGTTEDVVKEFGRIFNNNKGKVILLASHHPFMSYGNHGGHFTLMQHLFPFRGLSKVLYVPVPLLGSLYAIAKTLIPAREDLRHPAYRTMIRKIDSVFAGYKNLIHVAGHEHGLQFIEKGRGYQVVSGSGAKQSNVVQGKYALLADASSGYVIADQLLDKSIQFSYYKVVDGAVIQRFKFLKRYIR